MHPQQQSSKSNPASRSSLAGEDPTNRIASIEQRLNRLCWQHDSLMPLLRFSDYSASLGRWESMLKNLNKKINDYEHSVEQLAHSQISKHLANHSPTKQLALGKSITTAQQKISELKSIVQNGRMNSNSKGNHLLNAGNVNAFVISIPITPRDSLKQSTIYPYTQSNSSVGKSHAYANNTNSFADSLENISKEKLDELQKYIELTLALFKNQITITELSGLKSSRDLSRKDKLVGFVTSYLEEEHFDDMRSQLQAIRTGLPQIDLLDFHEKTMQRLKIEMIELNQQVEQDLIHRISYKPAPRHVQLENLARINQKIQLIQWQFLGLQRKYYFQFSKLSQQKDQDHFLLHKSSQRLHKDINELKEGLELIKEKIDCLKSDR